MLKDNVVSFLYYLTLMIFGNLISGSSAFSKSSVNIWKLTVHIVSKPGLENFESKDWSLSST